MKPRVELTSPCEVAIGFHASAKATDHGADRFQSFSKPSLRKRHGQRKLDLGNRSLARQAVGRGVELEFRANSLVNHSASSLIARVGYVRGCYSLFRRTSCRLRTAGLSNQSRVFVCPALNYPARSPNSRRCKDRGRLHVANPATPSSMSALQICAICSSLI